MVFGTIEEGSSPSGNTNKNLKDLFKHYFVIEVRVAMVSRVSIDKGLYKELTSKYRRTNIGILLVGLVGLAVCIAIRIIYPNVNIDGFSALSLGICFFCIVILITLKVKINRCIENDKFLEVSILDDCFIANTIKNGETIGTIKVYFKEVTKMKDTDNYVFFCIGKGQMVPINKNDFSSDVLVKIKCEMQKFIKQ